jgi:hypothetical protein
MTEVAPVPEQLEALASDECLRLLSLATVGGVASSPTVLGRAAGPMVD